MAGGTGQRGIGAHEDTASSLILVAGVLPGLGQHAVVPVDVVRVEPQCTLLHVLLDRRLGLVLAPPQHSPISKGRPQPMPCALAILNRARCSWNRPHNSTDAILGPSI